MAEHLGALRGRAAGWPCSGVVSSQPRGAPCRAREKRPGGWGGPGCHTGTSPEAQLELYQEDKGKGNRNTMVNQGRLPRCGGRAQHSGPQWAADSRGGRWEDHVGPQSRDEWGVGGLEGVRKDLAGLSISLFVCPLATGLFFHRDLRWTDR